MSDRIPEVSGSSIVLLGSFNPKIFQPEWFARQHLLPQEEVDAAEVKVIVPQISQFETEQFVVQVTQERFFAASKPNAGFILLRDLVQGAFYILEHTPATAMGLNHFMHFPLASEEAWHRVGDKLAPKEGWKGILDGRPGMASLSILSQKMEPTKGPRYTIKVEPSGQVKFGVYFDVNEHHEALKDEGLRRLMEILGERWEETHTYASRIANRILDWTDQDD